MIFALYPEVVIKLGGERYVYKRSGLMFKDVAEIERASGMSFTEWEYELGRGSLMATAALLHMLRRREDIKSDFQTMDFAAFDLEVVPLHEDGSEFTQAEVTEDIERRLREKDEPGPTAAAKDAAAVSEVAPETPAPVITAPTSPISLNGSASARGNGKSSRGSSSASSKKQPTRT